MCVCVSSDFVNLCVSDKCEELDIDHGDVSEFHNWEGEWDIIEEEKSHFCVGNC